MHCRTDQLSVAIRSLGSVFCVHGLLPRFRWPTRLAASAWLALSLALPLQAISMYQLQLRGMAHWHGDVKPIALAAATAQLPDPSVFIKSVDALRLFGAHTPALAMADLSSEFSSAHRHEHVGYHAHSAAWLSMLTQWLDPDAQLLAQHDAADASSSLHAPLALLHEYPKVLIEARVTPPSFLVVSHISDPMRTRLERPPQHLVLA